MNKVFIQEKIYDKRVKKIKDMNRNQFILYLKTQHKKLIKSEDNSEVMYSWICKKLLKDLQ